MKKINTEKALLLYAAATKQEEVPCAALSLLLRLFFPAGL
jgi:hypothetical protein